MSWPVNNHDADLQAALPQYSAWSTNEERVTLVEPAAWCAADNEVLPPCHAREPNRERPRQTQHGGG